MGRRIGPVTADALQLPLADAALDGAITAFGARNLADLDAGLREAFRMLSPGARLVILEFSTCRLPTAMSRAAAPSHSPDDPSPASRPHPTMTTPADRRVIGLISDTHGLVRAGVHDALAGVELILHAGDVGGDEVLRELALIAPVRAVYGNTDVPGDPALHAEIVHRVGGLSIHVSHGHEMGSPTPAALLLRYPHDVIVYGHTHRALVTRADGRLVVNPGAAGHRRFDLVPSVGLLTIADGVADVQIVPVT